jgi:molecular chaperone GrpE
MKSEIQDPLAADPEADTGNRQGAASATEATRQELASQRDLYRQLAADFENFKRRSHQESDTRASAQKDSFVHELLPVIDNIERALASGPSGGAEGLYRGVEMTLKQLLQLLAKHGLVGREVIGEPFDPHQHEAIAQGHDPAQPHHAILEVAQRGYRRGTKTFRPAKVIVNDLTPPQTHRHAR